MQTHVARSLGATRWQAFRHVLLPKLLPGLVTASTLVFAFGAEEVPLVLGAHAPKALPIPAWQVCTDTDLATRPEAMAMASDIGGIGLALVAFAARFRTRADDSA